MPNIIDYVNIWIAILSPETFVKNCLLHDDDDDLLPFIIFLASPVLDEIALSINPMKKRYYLNISEWARRLYAIYIHKYLFILKYLIFWQVTGLLFSMECKPSFSWEQIIELYKHT